MRVGPREGGVDPAAEAVAVAEALSAGGAACLSFTSADFLFELPFAFAPDFLFELNAARFEETRERAGES